MVMQGILLVLAGVIVAIVDWLASTPKPEEPRWPRWVKLACAIFVAFVGLYGITEGYFAKRRGIALYEREDMVAAVGELEKARNSPFADRKSLDYLGLAYKKIADQTPDKPVADAYYGKSLEVFIKSRAEYPRSPYSKNGMINVYRRLQSWETLRPLAESFESELVTNTFQNDDGQSLTVGQLATLFVTIGNLFADPECPYHSDTKAVEYYRHALRLDPHNPFATLNLPPRLLNLVGKQGDAAARRALLQEAYEWGTVGSRLKTPTDQAFALLAVIEVLIHPSRPAVPQGGVTLSSAISQIEKNDSYDKLDPETWLVLADAHLQLGNRARAMTNLSRALAYGGRFTQEQREWANRLQLRLR